MMKAAAFACKLRLQRATNRLHKDLTENLVISATMLWCMTRAAGKASPPDTGTLLGSSARPFCQNRGNLHCNTHTCTHHTVTNVIERAWLSVCVEAAWL